MDRSAAYAARYVAKNIVAAGLAHRCQVQLAYAIGVAEPVSVNVDDVRHRHGARRDARKGREARSLICARPPSSAILTSASPIYRHLAAYGHMGREDLGVAWEKTDRTEELKKAVQG